MTDDILDEKLSNQTKDARTAAAGANASGVLSPAVISAEIEDILPNEGNAIVYSHAGASQSGSPGTGIMALRATIRNTSGFAIRLTEVRFDLLAESGGLLLPAGPQILFAASQIGANGVTDVFGQTDSDGPLFNAGQTRNIHVQKIQNGASQNVFFEEGTVDQVRLTFRFETGGLQEDVVVVREVRTAPNDNGTAAGSYLYPMKARDLRPGEFWSGASGTNNSHHTRDQRFAYDTGCRFVDPEGGSASGRMPGTNGAANLDFRYFARPIYAMADGVVTSVRRDSHDNLPGCRTDIPAANQVTIRHGNEVARYFHLMRWSVDPDLEVGSEVRAGQFLGLGGNSGSSTAPHLHVDVRDAATQSLRPLQFRDVYTLGVDGSDATVSNDDWLKLDGQALPAKPVGTDIDKIMLWPSRKPPRDLTRGIDSPNGNGDVAAFSTVALGPNVVVTASRMAANDRLRLFSYEIDGAEIELQSSSGNQANGVQELAATEVSNGVIAVVTRTNSGRHKIIVWERSGDGTLTRVSDSGSQASAGDLPGIASLGNGRVITAVRTQLNKLKLIAWDVSASDVTRLESSATSPEDIDRLAFAPAGASKVVSCTRNEATGKFKLRLWDVSDDGDSINEIADSGSEGWSVDHVSVLGFGPDLIVTATNDARCSRANLTAWVVDGDSIRPLGDAGSQGDKIDSNEVMSLTDLGDQCFAVGLSDHKGKARLSVWCVEPDYGSVTLLGHSGDQMGSAPLVSAVATARDRIAVTATVTSGKQKVIEFNH